MHSGRSGQQRLVFSGCTRALLIEKTLLQVKSSLCFGWTLGISVVEGWAGITGKCQQVF